MAKQKQIQKGIFMDLEVGVIQIKDDQNQRSHFEKDKLKSLGLSFKENSQLQPIIINLSDGDYWLVAGERRLRAADVSKRKTIECKVYKDLTDIQVIQMMLAENRDRVNLNPIEEAHGFQKLMELGVKIPAIATSEHCSVDKVSKRLDLLKLHADVQDMMTRERNPLPVHQALIIKQLPADKQVAAAKKAAPTNGQVATEAMVREMVETILQPNLPGTQPEERKAPKLVKDTAKLNVKDAKDFLKSKPVPIVLGSNGKIGINTDGQAYLERPTITIVCNNVNKNVIIAPSRLILDLEADDLVKVAKFVKEAAAAMAKKTSRKRTAKKTTKK